MKALYKSIILNSVIYYGLIFLAGIFNVTASSSIALIFIFASTVIISINVMNFNQNFSNKKQLSFQECILSGFLTGLASWGLIYLTIFLPSFIMNSIKNGTGSFSFYIFCILTLIICLTFGGSIVSFFSIIFSPIFTKKKPDKRYFLFIASIIFISGLQVFLYIYLAILPIYDTLIIDKLAY